MRIPVAILLILVALVNGVAAAGYLVVGGVSAVVAVSVEEDGARETAPGGAPAIDATAAAAAGSSGRSLALFGLALLVTAALQLAASTSLFLRRAPRFVIGVAAFGVLVEVWGAVLGSLGVLDLVGLVTAALAVWVALRLVGATPRGRSTHAIAA